MGRGKHGFTRGRGGQVRLHLDDAEKFLLKDLIAQLLDLVAADPVGTGDDPLAAIVGITEVADKPTDPALARLLPDGYAEPDAAAEFRRFTQGDLRAQKAANARMVLDTLAESANVKLTPPQVQAWLRTLNDLRLVLAVRLGITDEDQAHWELVDEPARSMYLVYDWLTFHQDRLVAAASG